VDCLVLLFSYVEDFGGIHLASNRDPHSQF
jgi:hypothetical protein